MKNNSIEIKTQTQIFVTVGTDLPFNRLIKAIDEWSLKNRQFNVFAQIGETDWKPSHIQYSKFIEPPEFKQKFREAEFIISHAGMGTILSALRFQKPLLVMPRIAAKGEHRNEHQLATARYLSSLNKVNVADNEIALVEMLNNIDQLPVREKIGPYAAQSLTNKISNFITDS